MAPQSQVQSTKFVMFMCEEVLPVLGELPRSAERGDTTLEILKLTAELCTHAGTLEQPAAKLQSLYDKLMVSAGKLSTALCVT